MVKEFLSSKGIEFDAIDVSADAKALDEMIARTGAMATPVVIVGDEVVVGWDRGKLQRILGL